MKVGILGSGVVGQTLGNGFAERGHDVILGSRTPDSRKLTAWARKAGPRARAGTFADAVSAEVLVLAVQGSAAEDVVRTAGRSRFDGKLLIDATNPLDFSHGGSAGLFVGLNDSLSERLQRQLPRAKVVKCFNTVPSSRMVDPKLPGRRAEMLICGDDRRAKARVARILKDFGWSGVIDVGGIESARWLEALVPLWVRVGEALGTWDHCFQVVRS